MSDDAGFALPAFKPADALVQLKRTLRDLRPLAERGPTFELKGQAVVLLEADAQAIAAKLARRPGRSPEWDAFRLASNADVRKFTDEARKRLARWSNDDER